MYLENSTGLHRPVPRIFADTREIYGAKYFSLRNIILGKVSNILEVVRGDLKVSISRAYAAFAILPLRSTDNNRVSRISLITNEGRSAVGRFPFLAIPPRAG